MNQPSHQSKGKMLLSLLAKVSKNQKENPQTISSQHYNHQIHIKQQELKKSDSIKQFHSPKQEHYNNQNQVTENESLIKIYIQLFGEQEYQRSMIQLNRQKLSKRSLEIKKQQFLVKSILQQIFRLQQIRQDYTKYHKLLQKSAKGGTNEQKWKIIVLTYREKLQKYEYQLEQQKRLKCLIQKELDSRIEEIERLSNMNNLKFQKINEVIEELDLKSQQIEEKNNIIIQIQMNLSTVNIKNQQIQSSLVAVQKQKQKLKQELMQVTHSLNQITQTLNAQRQKSFLQPQKQQSKVIETNVLEQDEEIDRQIYDLKQKYQFQIQQLESKLIHYQEQIEQLSIQLSSKDQLNYLDGCTQTQQNVVKVCYYNSLQDDLQGQHSPQQPGRTFNQFDDQISELQLSIDPKSSHNHIIHTPRQMGNYSERDQHNYINDASFEDGNSIMSNSPSRYMETVEQLTSQLAQAYQKINQLTKRIETLEQENKRLKAKNIQEKRKPIEEKFENRKSLGGYFTNFFKK